jgi:hypothetical protein
LHLFYHDLYVYLDAQTLALLAGLVTYGIRKRIPARARKSSA